MKYSTNSLKVKSASQATDQDTLILGLVVLLVTLLASFLINQDVLAASSSRQVKQYGIAYENGHNSVVSEKLSQIADQNEISQEELVSLIEVGVSEAVYRSGEALRVYADDGSIDKNRTQIIKIANTEATNYIVAIINQGSYDIQLGHVYSTLVSQYAGIKKSSANSPQESFYLDVKNSERVQMGSLCVDPDCRTRD